MSRHSLTLLVTGLTLALASPALAQDPVGALLGTQTSATVAEPSMSQPTGDEMIDDLNRGVLEANAAVAASDVRAQADWEASVAATDAENARLRAEWEANARDQDAAYARAQADWEAENARRMAEWRARVAACEAGDRWACQPQ